MEQGVANEFLKLVQPRRLRNLRAAKGLDGVRHEHRTAICNIVAEFYEQLYHLPDAETGSHMHSKAYDRHTKLMTF